MTSRRVFNVFISHDTRDYAVAERLSNTLERLQAHPYIYEAYPQYRRDIASEIIEVLRNCKLCLCLLTGNGIESQWVHQELGAAFAFNRVIIPCIQKGIEYKGFVQFQRRIDYAPDNFERFAYEVIWAVREEFLGHGVLPLELACASGHRHTYVLPTTDEINDAMEAGRHFIYSCEECETEIRMSPWTLEEIPIP